jgi:type I restriction enzyme S subunit
MSNWKTYKLGELGTLARGKSKHRPRDAAFLYGGEYPFIQTGDIKAANHRIDKHTQTYSEEGLKQSKLWPAGTICITIAANIADTAILSYPACFPDSVIGFVADERKCNVDFIEYLLQYTKRSIQSHSIGSVQDNINLGTFENFTIEVPDLPTQQKIASILSSLDDKIELNLQMNQTLETMARAIFREWFVNFNFPGFDGELVDGLPKGWKMGKLGDVLELLYGKALKADIRIAGKYPVLGSSGIVDYHNEYLVEAPGIVIGRKGTIGEVIWVNENFFPIDTTFYVNDLLEVDGLYFHYFLLKEQEFKKIASDSAVPGLNRNQAMDNEVTIPDVYVIKDFNAIIKSIFLKREENINQIKTLTQIRDSLLPKLMTGKIEMQA